MATPMVAHDRIDCIALVQQLIDRYREDRNAGAILTVGTGRVPRAP